MAYYGKQQARTLSGETHDETMINKATSPYKLTGSKFIRAYFFYNRQNRRPMSV